MSAIHQISPGFTRGDAIANEAMVLRDLFRAWGMESDIFSEINCVLPELRRSVRDVRELSAGCRPDDVVLLHLSIGSMVNDVFKSLTCRKAILYHNITPACFFQGVHEETARRLAWGREQAAALAGHVDVVMAASQYNAAELNEMGYQTVQVLPILLDASMWREKPDRRMLELLQDGKVNVLFVGRCAPNKRIEDVLAAFHYFQKFVEPNSRLIHAGSYAGLERYHAMLLAQAHALQVSNVVFTGALTQAELNACYAGSHVFLCMSEHEGFCIPLLEAMDHGLPVLAHAAAAIPETMDGAGVLFAEKRFDWISETMGEIMRNRELREAIIAGQRSRMQRYMARDLAGELRLMLEQA